MTVLRQRMLEDMRLHGFSQNTQDGYLRAVRMLAEHYHKAPDKLTEEELRRYLCYLREERNLAAGSFGVHLSGLKFFFHYTVPRPWQILELVRATPGKKLPVVLTQAEVHQLLQAVKRLRYRVCLATIYSCGLRIREGIRVRVQDIDSQQMVLHVPHAKGNKARYVPAACPDPGTAANLWVYSSQPGLAVPLCADFCPAAHRCRPADGGGCPGARVSGGPPSLWAGSTGHCPHAEAQLRHALAGSRCGTARHPGISGAHLAEDHLLVYAPDPATRSASGAGGQPTPGGVVSLELAEVFARYGETYCQKYGSRMPTHQRQVMRAVETCRTARLGGQVARCPDCQAVQYRYHSCRNRHCPKCQSQKGSQWLDTQQACLLPVPYFFLTFTLPEEIRAAARRHPEVFYGLLFRASAAATQKLAQDPRFVGGQIGMIGVLHTWGRTLTYHPHVHYHVPGGGLAADGQAWLPARKTFLFPVKALARLFRGAFRHALRQTPYYAEAPASAWQQAWIVHCQPLGDGRPALKYLAPYIFRVALSNRRLVRLEAGQVTFRYRATDTGKLK